MTYPFVQIEAGVTEASLASTIAAYFKEAHRLHDKYGGQINLPIGFEGEWINTKKSSRLIQEALETYPVDFFIGSIHHTCEIPIDFDKKTYQQARGAAVRAAQACASEHDGRTLDKEDDEIVFEKYFDEQYEMLSLMRPPVIGHFDLIRLYSDEPNAPLSRWPGVWSRIERNLQCIVVNGGLLEVNSSALRKGLSEPYPSGQICRKFLSLGGKLVLSDDSHAVEQVGLNYHIVGHFLKNVAEAQEIYFLEHDENVSADQTFDERFPHASLRSIGLGELSF